MYLWYMYRVEYRYDGMYLWNTFRVEIDMWNVPMEYVQSGI